MAALNCGSRLWLFLFNGASLLFAIVLIVYGATGTAPLPAPALPLYPPRFLGMRGGAAGVFWGAPFVRSETRSYTPISV